MPIFSMTGFGRSVVVLGDQHYVWEIKSVNARGLELRFKLPVGLDELEPRLRDMAREALGRGHCQIGLRMRPGSSNQSLRLNEGALALTVAAAKRLADVDGIEAPTADGILAIRGVLEEAVIGSDPLQAEGARETLETAFGEALKALLEARRDEGSRLEMVLADLMDSLDALVKRAAERAQDGLQDIQSRIEEQVSALKSDTAIDPDRLHQEAVLLAVKSDIREEIDRLQGHLQSVRDRMGEGSPVGRRLDFLAQEMNREANTICSKAWDKELVNVGVDLKTGIDQFREQVQNLE